MPNYFFYLSLLSFFSYPMQQTRAQIKLNNKLISAIFRNKPKKVSYLLSVGADIDYRTALYHDTPLMLAFFLKNSMIVEELLEWNPNVHCMNCMGETALSYALLYYPQDLVLVYRLLERNASLRQRNIFGSWLIDRITPRLKDELRLMIDALAKKDSEKKEEHLYFQPPILPPFLGPPPPPPAPYPEPVSPIMEIQQLLTSESTSSEY